MSMLCPKCGELARCLDSRRTRLGHVKRMFRCVPCDLKFKSLEVIIEVRKGRKLVNPDD